VSNEYFAENLQKKLPLPIKFAENHVNMNWNNVHFVDEKVFSSSIHHTIPGTFMKNKWDKI
jgi:hypothetical protein